MNTKDIEELKDEAVNIWAEQDIYQALDYVITTLTQHHEAEVEKVVEAEKEYSYLMKFEPNLIATATGIRQTHKSIAVTEEDDDEMYEEMIGLLRDLVVYVHKVTKQEDYKE